MDVPLFAGSMRVKIICPPRQCGEGKRITGRNVTSPGAVVADSAAAACRRPRASVTQFSATYCMSIARSCLRRAMSSSLR